jgi:hypothetical protein
MSALPPKTDPLWAINRHRRSSPLKYPLVPNPRITFCGASVMLKTGLMTAGAHTAGGATIRNHRHDANSVRIASSLRLDMISGGTRFG